MRTRRTHRLPATEYIGQKAVSFTVCERDRRPRLANARVFRILEQTLTTACERHGCTVPIFTAMPDHLHILMLGMADDTNITKAFDQFKRLSGTGFTKIENGPVWQPRSHDEILRDGAWPGKARYIAQNPYRANLCNPDEPWPYTGSIGHDLQEIILDAFW
ncbi:hypothetical protein BH11ARM2_BH11ARM2_18570 [soil metagenome]